MLEQINRIVWGGPTLILILAAGLYLSVRSGLVQIRLFPKAFRVFISKFTRTDCHDGVSAKQALCTALAATVGTGNLAGVAGAIAIGGPGAVFWMWISALGGMILKFAEAVLSVKFRTVNENDEIVGGPMYMICNGLSKKWHWLAFVYCFFGVVAAFGVGNATQINTLIGSINGVLEIWNISPTTMGNALMGVGFAFLAGVMLFGGAGRIGRTAEKLVPLAAVFYIVISVGVLVLRADRIPGAFYAIIKGAFSPDAITGGIIGSAFRTLCVGVSRGVFTNEAGMGTAGIAHGAANVNHPVEQGLMGIMEVFLDTIVICTLTALVILCSGVPIPYGADSGISLTNHAFSSVYGEWVQIILTLAVCCFAFATILGWGLYGARCAQFLFGTKAWLPFSVLQTVVVLISAVLKTETVWQLAEIVNGLMAIPNLIAVLLLSPELFNLIRQYKQIC